MTVLLANNAKSKLASSLSSGATTLSVTTGEGAKFPSPGAGQWFPLTLVKSTGVLEIVRCTARSGDVFTVTRAQESTSSTSFAAGDRVELRLTKAALDEFPQGTAFFKDLAADADAAAGRATLELGTVATRDRQTSSTDTTAGRVLEVGAFGLGSGSAPLLASNDYNNGTVSGYARNDNGSAAINYPPQEGASNIPIVVHSARYNSNYGWQISVATRGASPSDSTLRGYLRNQVNGSWSNWSELFHSVRGGVVTSDSGQLGFATGSGGSVTQATSKATAVTLNKPAGKITTHNAALAAGATVQFTMNNSTIEATDVLLLSASLNANYRLECPSVFSGVATIRITNVSGGSLSEAIGINFVVIKGANA